MSKVYQRITSRVGSERELEEQPTESPGRAVQGTELERLKTRLLREQLENARASEFDTRLRRAANEAAAVAWATNIPLLVFPVLFEEKSRTAVVQAQRQAYVRQRSRELLAL